MLQLYDPLFSERGYFITFEEAAREIEDKLSGSSDYAGFINFDKCVAELVLENEALYLLQLNKLFPEWFTRDPDGIYPIAGIYDRSRVYAAVKSMMRKDLSDYIKGYLPEAIFVNMATSVGIAAKQFINDMFDIEVSYDNFSYEICTNASYVYHVWAYQLIKCVMQERSSRPYLIIQSNGPKCDYEDLAGFNLLNDVTVVYTRNIKRMKSNDHFVLNEFGDPIMMNEDGYLFSPDEINGVSEGAIPDMNFHDQLRAISNETIMISKEKALELMTHAIAVAKACDTWVGYQLYHNPITIWVDIYARESMEQTVRELFPNTPDTDIQRCIQELQQGMMNYVDMHLGCTDCSIVVPHEILLDSEWHIIKNPVEAAKAYFPFIRCECTPKHEIQMMLESACDNGYYAIQLMK